MWEANSYILVGVRDQSKTAKMENQKAFEKKWIVIYNHLPPKAFFLNDTTTKGRKPAGKSQKTKLGKEIGLGNAHTHMHTQLHFISVTSNR